MWLFAGMTMRLGWLVGVLCPRLCEKLASHQLPAQRGQRVGIGGSSFVGY